MSNNLGGLVTGQILKGVQRTEMMLSSGTTLTGVGELVVSPDGNFILELELKSQRARA